MAAGDTYLKDTDGETLLHTDGATAIHEDCCCVAPCTDCGDTQDSVTVSTNCGGCDAYCQTADGTYTWQTFLPGAHCQWYWLGPTIEGNTWHLCVQRWGDAFIVALSYRLPDESGWAVYRNSDASGLSCNKTTGQLEGTIVVPGVQDDPANDDCSSGSATVVF